MSDKNLPIAGGCLCGAVRYESEEPPTDSNYCHCRICQNTTGAPVSAFVEFAGRSFRLTVGEPRYYQSSNFAERGSCATCGSRLIYRPMETDEAGSIFIHSCTLDRPADAGPEWHAGIESQVPWLTIDDELPKLKTEDNPDVAALKSTAQQDEA